MSTTSITYAVEFLPNRLPDVLRDHPQLAAVDDPALRICAISRFDRRVNG
jgi:hypothetical protein